MPKPATAIFEDPKYDDLAERVTQALMSSAPLPHQQYISGTSATDGAQAFAGINLGNVYYGNAAARKC